MVIDNQKEIFDLDKSNDNGATPKVNWDDNNMRTTYANVCNVLSTREEVTLLFGTNQTWYNGQKELTVKLSERIIMNPFAAKRLSLLLGNVVDEYEKRFGSLNTDAYFVNETK